MKIWLVIYFLGSAIGVQQIPADMATCEAHAAGLIAVADESFIDQPEQMFEGVKINRDEIEITCIERDTRPQHGEAK